MILFQADYIHDPIGLKLTHFPVRIPHARA